jgi:hydroxypyruvate isomerase
MNHPAPINPVPSEWTRRTLLKTLAGSAAMAACAPWADWAAADELKGRIKQSVCLWCYNGYMKRTGMTLDEFAAACAKMGLKSIELVGPDVWPTLKKHGLICAMTPSHGIPKGLNRLENHDECLAAIRKGIDASAEAGFPNVITFSGNREGLDDQQGLKNCAIGLKKIAGYAEEKKVTICLEYLNSINHRDYMADSTDWCVALVREVGSPRVKVLYDIYHAGMMKDDPLADIQKHHECWGHYHTGGVPGRNEIDDTQTLDYPALMRAIVQTGFDGYVGQEFIPKREDAMNSLQQAVGICDV